MLLYALGLMAGVAGTINLSLTVSVMADVKLNAAMSHMSEAFPPVFIGAFTMELLTAGCWR